MNIGKIRVNTELNTTKFDNKMDKLENDLDIAKQKADQAEQKFVDLSNTLENFPKWKVDTDEYRKLADNVDKANVAWQQATNKVDEYSNKIKEVSLQQEKAVFDSKGKSSVNATKLVKKLKRVGLALFSIRSAYTLVSRASSAYLSKDTELAEKLQSVWVGLGSFLAPLLEYLSNMLLKMVGYLNVFVKALTGIDFVARANAKALNKQAKAQKNLNNQMLSFDEINKLEDTTSKSGGASAGSGLIELPELDDKMVKKLQDLAYWLKENWRLIKEVGIALGIAFGAAKIAQLVGNVSTLIGGGGKGIKGLTKSLNEIPTMIKIGITVGGVAYTINTVKKIKQDTKDLNEQTESLREKMREIYYLKWSKETNTNNTLEEQNRLRQVGLESLGEASKWYNKIIGASESYLGDAMQTVYHSKGNLEALKQQYQAQSNNKEKQKEILKGLIDQYNYNLAMIVALERQGVETGELETINNGYKETIKQTSEELGVSNEELGKMLDDSVATNKETQAIAANIKDINDVNLENKELIVDVKANTSSFKTKMKQIVDSIKSWANGIGGGFSVLWDKLTGGGGGGGRGFATGGIGTGIGLGAIVNNPGKGVSIGGGNIAGERGREGIIPLTDPRAMADLGQQIGRWVSVNLDITNQIDGRVLNRRLEAIKNESNFTTNGGVL